MQDLRGYVVRGSDMRTVLSSGLGREGGALVESGGAEGARGGRRVVVVNGGDQKRVAGLEGFGAAVDSHNAFRCEVIGLGDGGERVAAFDVVQPPGLTIFSWDGVERGLRGSGSALRNVNIEAGRSERAKQRRIQISNNGDRLQSGVGD